MPIYAYRCATCGHAQDVLRKMSDPPLNVCPACGAPTFVKQVTAAGFQLKGSGWYVTDFRDGKKPGKPAETGAAAETNGSGAGDAAPANGANTDGAKTDGAKTDAGKPAEAASPAAAKKGDAAPAPVAAPAPAAAPATDKGKA
jgi:putative FmdB family regulatory protein